MIIYKMINEDEVYNNILACHPTPFEALAPVGEDSCFFYIDNVVLLY